MKRIISAALLVVTGLAATGSALAQDPTLRATVPFDFSVGSTLLPSGTYTFVYERPSFLRIQNREKRSGIVAMARAGDPQSGDIGKLIFDKYGDQYFLSQAFSPYSDMSVVLPTSKLEKRIQNQEASYRRNEHTLVALK